MSDIAASSEALEALRSEIAELDALTEPTEEQAARFTEALAEWDTNKAAHDALTERAAKVEAVRAASLLPINAKPSTAPVGVSVASSGALSRVASSSARSASASSVSSWWSSCPRTPTTAASV